MKLFKRDNSPYWWYEFSYMGKRTRASTLRPHSDKVGAHRVMHQEYLKYMNAEQLGDLPEITLKDAFAISVAEAEGKTKKQYESCSNKILKVLDPNLYCSHLRTHHVEHLVKVRKNQGLKPNSIRGDLKYLKRATARVRGSYRVSEGIQWPKVSAFMKTRYLTEAEERDVLRKLKLKDTLSAEKAHDLAVFLIDTGLRLREAADLQWSSVDKIKKQIEVFRPKTRTVSTVPTTNRVLDMLVRRSNQRQPFEHMERAIQILRDTIHEVCNQDQTMVAQRGAATIHSLRDTYATRLIQRGLSLHKLSKLLGHTNTAMTAKYAHLEVQDVVDEARALL